MGGDTLFLKHPQHLGRHFHSALGAINHDGDGVQIVFEWPAVAVFGMGNFVTHVSDDRIFEGKA